MPDRERFDARAGIRAMADVQRAGLEAAAAVVERVLELGRQSPRATFPLHLPAEGVDRANGDRTNGAGERGREARRLRADGEQLIDRLGESVRVLLDLVADAAGAGEDGAGGVGDRLSLGPVRPGAAATGQAWLHVLDGPPAQPAHLKATPFTAHDGTVIEAQAASFEPPLLETFALRSSQEISITVRVPEGIDAGVYHGHVLATGLPEVALAIRIEVTG